MPIRRPVVAGQFYPSEPDQLRAAVEAYVDAAGVKAAPARVAAILAPHAGYRYSGPTAGHAFARVRGKSVRRVVLLGRSHRYLFDGISVYPQGAFQTPLGSLPVDEAFARELIARVVHFGVEPHVPEHGLEVELPFLQVVLGDVPIVPVLFGADPQPSHVEVGELLAGMMSPEDLLVISTDLSHYLDEASANTLDRHSLQRVLDKDCQALLAGERSGECSLCGATAVVAGMACSLARGADAWQLLDYRTSAQASGDYARVVGYGAISMERAA